MGGQQVDAVLLRGFDHPVGLLDRDGHRLLDQHVFAVAHRFDRVFAMEAIGRRDPNRFDFRVLAQLGDRRVRARTREALDEAFAHAVVGVGTGDEDRFRQLVHGGQGMCRALTQADHAHFQLTHCNLIKRKRRKIGLQPDFIPNGIPVIRNCQSSVPRILPLRSFAIR